MNFLSHFYFERHNPNSYIVMGVVLPDLIKNANKDWNLNPQKDEYLYRDVPEYDALLTGWKRHLEVDRLFHNSDFFKEQTTVLKQLILPVLNVGPVKPFFLAHIALELVLDHLLIAQNMVNADLFYQHLSQANSVSLSGFLRLAKLPDQHKFDLFMTEFITSRYVLHYEQMENVTYSLNKICMRLWKDPFTKPQVSLLNDQLEQFKEQLKDNFLPIFNQIDGELYKNKH